MPSNSDSGNLADAVALYNGFAMVTMQAFPIDPTGVSDSFFNWTQVNTEGLPEKLLSRRAKLLRALPVCYW